MNTIDSSEYRTLSEIRLRKAQLITDITKDSNKIQSLWNRLFHSHKEANTPTQRFSGLMSTGAGILDGLILGWKIYRKFGGKKKTGFFKK